MQSLSEYYERAPKTVPPSDVSSRTICAKNRMGLFAKKGETIRSKSILWVGSPIIVLEVL